MPSAYRRFRDVHFFNSLDGLRAISILGVIWFHSWYGTAYFARLESIPVFRKGWFGVDIFFAISGFLITTLLLREQERDGRISLRGFYARRALRIWPLYYAVLGLYVAMVLLAERGTARGHAFFHYLPSYLTYTYTWFGQNPNESPPIFNFAWTLATEEQFYLFWPFALQWLRRPWPAVLMVAMGAVGLAASYVQTTHAAPVNAIAHRLAVCIAVPICLGALLAQMLYSPRGFSALHRILGHKWSAPAALAALAACLVPYGDAWRPLAWAVLPALVGACVIREDHGLAPILRWRPLAFIGVVSYGMYLFNTLAVKFVRPAAAHAGLLHPALVFPFVVATTALLAGMSYRYFESPFLALKRRFSPKSPVRGERTLVIR
ncbi:MAG: acyltransferase 3 [Phycisphaerales bacterium]|nr:acyltransferase 3 [Phycisphaerales bacterium]